MKVRIEIDAGKAETLAICRDVVVTWRHDVLKIEWEYTNGGEFFTVVNIPDGPDLKFLKFQMEEDMNDLVETILEVQLKTETPDE